MSNGLIVLLILVAVAVGWTVTVFNRLVRTRNRMNNAYAQIDVQLKRRHDLVPNLVNTARGYLKHERQTLEGVTLARQRASDARQAVAGSFGKGDSGAGASSGDGASGGGAGKVELLEALDRAEAGLNTALGKFSMVVEAYPELKADQTIMQLSEELTSTENRIAFARQAYNDSVMGYNNKREVFPSNIIAGMFGFIAAALLEITDPAQREAPKVSF